MKKTDITIIGAGIAGITAAIYLKRANANFVILEGDKVGGMLNKLTKIENYPAAGVTSGEDLLVALKDQLQNLDIEVTQGFVQTILKNEDGFEVITDKDLFISKAVILATGASKQSSFIKGEKEYFGKGVSYCATCDANFFKNNDVAVIGNNNVVLEESLYLSNIVKQVYLISESKLIGDEDLISKVQNKENIKILQNENVLEIKGDEFGVTKVILNDREIECLGVFPFVSKKNTLEVINQLNPQVTDSFIDADENMQSNIPGLFVVGDIRNKKLRQLILSASDGAIAATSALKFIQ